MGGCHSSKKYLKVPNEKRFRRAIKLYEVSEVESLVNIVNRNRCFETGQSPLTLAAEEGHEAVVEMLIKGGADVNRLDRNGRGPLHIAVQMNDVETVDVLLQRGSADPNKFDRNSVTPLHIACERGFKSILEKLLRSGANPNENYGGSSPLILAVYGSHGDCVDVLLKHGTDPNVKDVTGESALRLAVANGNARITRSLLQAQKRCLDAAADDNDATDEREGNLGVLAALNGQIGILEALVASGYDVISPSNVNDIPPPLISATVIEAVDYVTSLLNQPGSNPDVKDKVGQTALQIATMSVVDLSKQQYYLRYFSNVYRQFSKYDRQQINAENCIKCATSLIQSGADVSTVWSKFIHVFPSNGVDSISFEQMVICEVLVQAYGFIDIPDRKLRTLIKNLLNIRELGLVKLVYSAGVEPSREDGIHLAMSCDESDKAMICYIKMMSTNPRTLKDICRQRLRRHLSSNVLHLASKLPITENLKDYVCIIDTDCYSN